MVGFHFLSGCLFELVMVYYLFTLSIILSVNFLLHVWFEGCSLEDMHGVMKPCFHILWLSVVVARTRDELCNSTE